MGEGFWGFWWFPSKVWNWGRGGEEDAENDGWVLLSVRKGMGCDAIVLQNKMGWATEVLGLIRQNSTVARSKKKRILQLPARGTD